MMHKDFITSSIKNTISSAISSINAIGGMGISAMKDFYEQALLLQLTGALEQKCKCISWEIATKDFKYRYEHFEKNSMLGYSELRDKSKLFVECVQILIKQDSNYLINKKSIIDNLCDFINQFSTFGSFAVLYARNYFELNNSLNEIKEMLGYNELNNKLLVNIDNLSQPVKNKYNVSEFTGDNPLSRTVYNARNHIAHNTKSYQKSSISFEKFRSNLATDNFLSWLLLLIYIDEMFIKVYIELIPQLQTR